jgi:hypothetical protein
VVPNPYTLLSQIPLDADWFTVLDLNDAFFYIPTHSDSQHLFTFEDPETQLGQLTWTILPQGFRDRPHLFGQALAKDLQQFKVPKSTVIWYVDDILLCSPSKQHCEENTVKLLNFLAKKGIQTQTPGRSFDPHTL